MKGLVLLVLFWATTCSAADTAYSWQDPSGRTMFGSKPPAGAKNVKKVAGETFSRYSSERLLRGHTGAKKAKPVTETETALPVKAPDLIHDGVEVERDEKRAVTKCEVLVHNVGGLTASDVTVSFEFGDGTVVPAEGPDLLDAGAESRYRVADALLPIVLKEKRPTADGSDPFSAEDSGEIALPRVVLNFQR